MKLRQSICAGGKVIAAGTDIFACESIDVSKLPLKSLAKNPSEFAKALIDELNKLWPNGFSKQEFEDANISVCGFNYSIMQVGDEHVLMIRTDTDGIEIYLVLDNRHRYKPTGEYHIASDASQGAAIEALLNTKGALALDALVSVIATVIEHCPASDKAQLRKILQAAYRASNSSKPKQDFYKYIGKAQQ